jgi:hypothetical protein
MGIPQDIAVLQAEVAALQAETAALQAQAAALQTEINASGPLASAAATALPAISAADMDGKAVRVVIAGRSATDAVRVFLNGSQILLFGQPAAGFTFIRTFTLVWSSVNQDVWGEGSPSLLSSFNPATFTFSTDSGNIVTDFRVELA